MFDASRLRPAVAILEDQVAALEPGCLTGDDARALLVVFARVEKLAAAARTLLAKRIEDTFVPSRAASALPPRPSRATRGRRRGRRMPP